MSTQPASRRLNRVKNEKIRQALKLLSHEGFGADYITKCAVHMITVDIKLQVLYNLAYDGIMKSGSKPKSLR